MPRWWGTEMSSIDWSLARRYLYLSLSDALGGVSADEFLEDEVLLRERHFGCPDNENGEEASTSLTWSYSCLLTM